MEHVWDPFQYAWNPETLQATLEVLSDPSPGAQKAKKPAKRRTKNARDIVCQIDGCSTRLDTPYYKKYRVCPVHAKAPAVTVGGKTVRFCQKCARFQDLSEFDLDRRSCRARLAEHNRRRRELTQSEKNVEHLVIDQRRVSRPKPLSSGSLDYSEDFRSFEKTTQPAVSDSVYHTPCSSDHSMRDTSVPLPGNEGISDSLDPLLVPLAANLHTFDQILPSARNTALAADFARQQQQVPQTRYITAAELFAAPEPEPSIPVPNISTDSCGMDVFGDLDLDLVLNDILDPVPDPILPPPPVYTSSDTVVRISMKLFSCLPTDLPPALKAELEKTLNICPNLLEGCLRPGCSHLTVDLRVTNEVAEKLKSASLEDIITELSKVLPAESGLLAQLDDHIVAMKQGKVYASVDMASSDPAKAPRLAALSRVCVSVDEAASMRINLYGNNIGRPGDMILCRQHGRHTTVDVLETANWQMVPDEDEEAVGAGADDEDETASVNGVLDIDYVSMGDQSAASSQTAGEPHSLSHKPSCTPAASVRLLGLLCGVAEVEVQAGGVMSAAKPLLVLPDAAVAAEVESLASRARRAPWLESFLRDVGVVIAHICSEGAAARAHGPYVEKLAKRTADYCVEAGCPRLSRLLRRAQTALRKAIGNDDTASAMEGAGSATKPKPSIDNDDGDLVDNNNTTNNKKVLGMGVRQAVFVGLGGLAMAVLAGFAGAS